MKVSRKALGQAIAAARQQGDMTQEALGLATDLGQTAISRIETGERRLEATELMAIADALDVDLSQLLHAASADREEQGLQEGVELVALRLEQGDDANARAMRTWVVPFLERLETLERRVGQ